jgi:alpha-ribazole phosphatase
MKIVLIRHGATAGNIKKRYIGITDEDLCASGIESIHNNIKAGYYQEYRQYM